MFRLVVFVASLAVATTTAAHFPWLYVADDSEPRLFFGEGLDHREYHLPDAVAGAEVWQEAIDAPALRLEMEPLEEEGFLGLAASQQIEPRGFLRTTIDYGNYHGSRLIYDAQHFPAENPEAWPEPVLAPEGLSATLRVEGDQLVVVILHSGAKPLTGAKVTLSNAEGGPGLSAATDDNGSTRFSRAAMIDGLNGLMVMHVDKRATGEISGKGYASTTRILTATFNYRSREAAKVSALQPLPQAVASFGAAVSEGQLYVYGGHIGQAHDHSRENLSGYFGRISLDGGGWESLPAGPPLQGLPLVAHEGQLYRVGGLDARNASGEEEDLHSVDQFARFDPGTGRWTDLQPLPGPRSSHNAAVLNGILYVVGGWALAGDSDGEWQAGAIAYDLCSTDAAWITLPEPPFKRRALAVSHVDGQLAVLCGMTEEAQLSKQVFFYNPASRSWSEGPDFPGSAFGGFGLSAWNLDGKLYAGGMEGVLYRLAEDRSEWEKVDEFQTKRFFHQLVPDGRGGLFAVAGASPTAGHTGSIERLDLVFAAPTARR
ncbi:hypothetical protein [Botrimarina hoheduenensis]|uniref:N-acetylneuraminate epimerase n=1 Tax=Botrimarina hoheduenensis TaxID=2528000 RepID=A0A5C5W9H8_9BACT|nr:hypothetical protein [Botrimarina hoheduenensis]TWT47526.1 N-acetylneuraminate epimerase [Botrimarina hoheduenensis]